LEVRVLDDSENCTSYRFQDGRGSDAAADVLDTAAWRCAGGEKLCQGNIGVGDTPVGDGPCALIAVRVQPKFITSDVEADVERFVEVRVGAQQLSEPGLAGDEIRRGMDDGT
jgi:hypothetical protein